MTGPSIASVVVYCIQVALVFSTATVATRWLAHRMPRARLAVWWSALGVVAGLPFMALPVTQPLAPTLQTSVAAFAAAAAPARGDHPPPLWLWGMVAAGIVARLLWLAAGALRLRTLSAASTPALLSAGLEDTVRSVAPHARMRLAAVAQPVSFGWRRPIVLLPERFTELPQHVQRAALIHECAHVVRHDWLSLLIERGVETALWFHPAAWWAVDQIQLAREQVVDAMVIKMTGDRRAYAQTLLAFADSGSVPAVASALFRRRHLARRVDALADSRVPSRRRQITAAVGLVLVMGVVSATAASLAPGDDTVYSAGNGVSLPSVIKEVHAEYTPDAQKAHITGTVVMTLVVDTNGVPDRVTVTESLDRQYGLDEAAVEAMRQWRFKPGLKDGKPVAVRITVQMAFTLK